VQRRSLHVGYMNIHLRALQGFVGKFEDENSYYIHIVHRKKFRMC
jgi:hypothetical protein